MIATMTLSQRLVTLWLIVLTVLIAFVVYLDGGFNSEPLILFTLLWLIDVAMLGVILLRCLHSFNVFGLSDYAVLGSVLPQLTMRPGLYACAVIASKFAFEITLYIQLRHRTIGVLWMMVPLWIFLGLCSFYLFQKIVEFHKNF